MRLNIILFLFTFFQTTIGFTQSQLSTDTSVKVFPHWKKGESHSVFIKSSTSEFSYGKTKNFLSTYKATFFISEKDTSGYLVEWTYTKAALAPNEITLENSILANLIGLKLIIKLSLTGKFKELINVEEVKSETEKVIDKLISNSEGDPSMNIQFKAAKQMISTKQGLEIVILKQIKFYNFSFGYNYKLNYQQTNKLKFANPFGGQPFDAIEKVELKKLDNAQSICVIETSKKVDVADLKKDLIEYLKKISKKDSKQIEDELQKENLELTESSMQQINFSKGLIQKSNFTRKMFFGFQNRTTILEIETID